MAHNYLKKGRLLSLAALAGTILAMASPAGAALQAVGPVSGPHGYPLYYTDTNNLSLELCLDPGFCFFDPVDPADPNQVALGIGGEVFWWMANAAAGPLTAGGNTLLVLALEGTFGGDESVVNGQQVTFGRIRIVVDVPVAGTYTVTHPYGTRVFEGVTVADGINYTADIGSANFLDVVNGFQGTLRSGIGPFLTWPDYQNNPALKVGVVQYVGDNVTPHVVVGSPTGNNFFRVEGPGGIKTETSLFTVMGRVFDGKEATAHTYPPPPDINLKAVGPLNRLKTFVPGSLAALVTDGTTDGYPLGYPIWYQDQLDLQLTLCPGSDLMCISDPITLSDPLQVGLGNGGETFWWAGDAAITSDSPLDDPTFVGVLPPPGLDGGGVEVEFDALLVLALEAAFGGDESLADGGQVAFGRTRIRIDTPVAGDYTVIYPYGVRTFENVPVATGGINMTADIGISDLFDPDSAFVGTLYSEIGPNILTWDTFNPDPLLNDPLLIKLQGANPVHYVGDPAIPHLVTGGTFEFDAGVPVNYFRVIGPGFDVRTELFKVQGKVFAPATFRVAPAVTATLARDDSATAFLTKPKLIRVLANDTHAGAAVPANATITPISLASNGTAIVNEFNTFTYTANEGFAGTDTFTYNATVNSQVSNTATVTVTVNPFRQFSWPMFLPAIEKQSGQ